MSKIRKLLIVIFIASIFTPFVSIFTPSIKAAEVVKVQLPCNRGNKSISDINAQRSHSDAAGNGGYAVDLQPGDECNSYNAVAAINGTVTYVGYSGYFSCYALGGASVRNSIIRIENAEGIRVDYLHNNLNASNTIVQGSTVTAGQIIGTIGRVGCATGDHIHFEVYKHGVKLKYPAAGKWNTNEWEFVETLVENPYNMRKISSIVYKGMLVQSIRDKNKAVYTRFKNNSNPLENPAAGWSPWEISGHGNFEPTFVVKGEYLYQFMIGTDGYIYYRFTNGKIKNKKFQWIRNWTAIETGRNFRSEPVVTLFNNRIILTANRTQDTAIIVLEFKVGVTGELHSQGASSEIGVSNRNSAFVPAVGRLYQFLTGKDKRMYYRYTYGVDSITKLNLWSVWFDYDVNQVNIESDINGVSIKVNDNNTKILLSFVKTNGEMWNLVYTLKNNNPSLGQAKLEQQHEGFLTKGEVQLVKDGNQIYQFFIGLDNKVYQRFYKDGLFSKTKNFEGTANAADSKTDVSGALYEGQIHLSILWNHPHVEHLWSRTLLTPWKKSGEFSI